jgi:hypothetical protein
MFHRLHPAATDKRDAKHNRHCHERHFHDAPPTDGPDRLRAVVLPTTRALVSGKLPARATVSIAMVVPGTSFLAMKSAMG